MNHIDNEEKSRLPGWICVEDAKKRNAENEALYSEDEKQLADMFAQQTRNAYIRSRVYLIIVRSLLLLKLINPAYRTKSVWL